MDMGLTGKVAWVTGATGAIGREIALSFARESARVAVSARTEEAVASLVDEIKRIEGNSFAVEWISGNFSELSVDVAAHLRICSVDVAAHLLF